jgi:hypothetical protein
MRINFILNAMGISGGVKAVFMFAQQLTKHQHEVNVIYPQMPLRIGEKLLHPVQLAKEAGYLALNRWQPLEWYPLATDVIQVQSLLHSKEIPDADITVATQWETVYYVKEYPKSKGEKFYLIQDLETWYGHVKEVVKTYKLGLRNIVHSDWLSYRLRCLNAPIEAVIAHAPDHNQFYPEKVKVENKYPVRILMCYRKEKWKGIADAVDEYRKVKGNTRLIMFGLPSFASLPADWPVDEYYENIKGDGLRRLYNSADIFVFPSEREGWGMPPMEAMACGVPVISKPVGAIPEFIVPGISGIIVTDKESMGKAMAALANDQNRRERIGLAAYEAMKNYTWEKSGKMLEELFTKWL